MSKPIFISSRPRNQIHVPKLAELLQKTENPFARLLIFGGTAIAQWAFEKRFDRRAVEKWEDEGGYVLDVEE